MIYYFLKLCIQIVTEVPHMKKITNELTYNRTNDENLNPVEYEQQLLSNLHEKIMGDY